MMVTIKFKYRNHRGKIADRTIDVDSIEFILEPGFDYQPGWFISGYCHTKQARRSFALTHIIFPETVRGIYKFMNLKGL